MPVAFFYHPDITKYDFGEGHPFRGNRFQIFFEFFREKILNQCKLFTFFNAEPADDTLLKLIHTDEYIESLKMLSKEEDIINGYNYLSGDNFNPQTGKFPSMVEFAARLIVGESVKATELVLENKFNKAIVIGGGLHHAKPNYGEGFCIYNDIAIAVENLKRKFGVKKIFVLDTDAHAGNGMKEIFYKDNNVLFVDIHQDPSTIYPGTGFIEEIGEGEGKGFTINVPLQIYTGNDSYKYVFEKLILPLIGEFKPQIFIRYGGSDPHYKDPLTNLGINLEGFRLIGFFSNLISKELCSNCVNMLLSGYNMDILPFAWGYLISEFVGLRIKLHDFYEIDSPPSNYKLKETKELLHKLKRILKPYWRCMEK